MRARPRRAAPPRMTPLEKAVRRLGRCERALAEARAKLAAAAAEGRRVDVMMERTSVQDAERELYAAQSAVDLERRRGS